MAESVSDDEMEFSVEHRVFNKAKHDMTTEGFRAGLSAGQEASLQEGFNQGYKQTLVTNSQLAHIRGKLTAVLCRALQTLGGHVTVSEDLIGRIEGIVEDLARLEKKLENDGVDLMGGKVDVGNSKVGISEKKVDSKDLKNDCTRKEGCCKGESTESVDVRKLTGGGEKAAQEKGNIGDSIDTINPKDEEGTSGLEIEKDLEDLREGEGKLKADSGGLNMSIYGHNGASVISTEISEVMERASEILTLCGLSSASGAKG